MLAPPRVLRQCHLLTVHVGGEHVEFIELELVTQEEPRPSCPIPGSQVYLHLESPQTRATPLVRDTESRADGVQAVAELRLRSPLPRRS